MISNGPVRMQRVRDDCCSQGDSDLLRARRDAEIVLEQVNLSLKLTASRLHRNDTRNVRRWLRCVNEAIHGTDSGRIRKALADLRVSLLKAVQHMRL